MGRLENRVAVITGATSGIGLASAELFAEEGAKVVFAGRRKAEGEAAEQALLAKGYEVKFVQTDVTKREDLIRLVDTAIGAYGRIDILFNNAGMSAYQRFEDMDMETADKIMDTNFRSVMELTRLVVPHMIAQRGGKIVNTSSIGGIIGSKTLVPYCASKGAIRLFTKGLAAELAEYGIRVNSLHPGLTLTDMTIHDPEFLKMATANLPLERGADPREIAYGALFLASDESSFMTASELVLDGGFTAVK